MLDISDCTVLKHVALPKNSFITKSLADVNPIFVSIQKDMDSNQDYTIHINRGT